MSELTRLDRCPKCWDNGKLSSVLQLPAQPSPVVQTPISEGSFVMPPECCIKTQEMFKGEAKWCMSCGKDLTAPPSSALAPVVPVGETWIPATERLPEFDVEVDVLIKGETRTIALRYYHDEGWCWSFITDYEINLNHKDWADFEMDDRDVTHWMPLPALPATGKEK